MSDIIDVVNWIGNKWKSVSSEIKKVLETNKNGSKASDSRKKTETKTESVSMEKINKKKPKYDEGFKKNQFSNLNMKVKTSPETVSETPSTNRLIQWFDRAMSSLFPEVEKNMQVNKDIKKINADVDSLNKNRLSKNSKIDTQYATANADKLSNLSEQLKADQKNLPVQETVTLKLWKGIHNLLGSPISSNEEIVSLEQKIGTAIDKNQNISKLKDSLELLSSIPASVEPLKINSSYTSLGLKKEANTLDQQIEKVIALKADQQGLGEKITSLEAQEEVLLEKIDKISVQIAAYDQDKDAIDDAFRGMGQQKNVLRLKKGTLQENLKEVAEQYGNVSDALKNLRADSELVKLNISHLESGIEKSSEWKSLKGWKKVIEYVQSQQEILNAPEGFIQNGTKNTEILEQKLIELEKVQSQLIQYRDKFPELSDSLTSYAKGKKQLENSFPSKPTQKVISLSQNVQHLRNQISEQYDELIKIEQSDEWKSLKKWQEAVSDMSDMEKKITNLKPEKTVRDLRENINCLENYKQLLGSYVFPSLSEDVICHAKNKKLLNDDFLVESKNKFEMLKNTVQKEIESKTKKIDRAKNKRTPK